MDTVPRPTHPDEIVAMLRERAAVAYWCPVCKRSSAVYMRQDTTWHPDRIECFRCGHFWLPYADWVSANAAMFSDDGGEK